MKVKNITDDSLGWHGKTIGAGSEIDVDDETAQRMVEQHPQKFQLAGSKAKADDPKAGTTATS